MNQALQDKTLSELERLASGTEPFFLQYWPIIPLDNTRAGCDGPETQQAVEAFMVKRSSAQQ